LETSAILVVGATVDMTFLLGHSLMGGGKAKLQAKKAGDREGLESRKKDTVSFYKYVLIQRKS